MRFDGHVKITLHALDILVNLSGRKDVPWPAPTSTIGGRSTPAGHWSGVFDYLQSPFAGLPQLVAGLSDITNARSHFAGDLQRMHFMRATDENEWDAYTNAVSFIRAETENWIRARTEGFWDTVARSAAKSILAPAPALAKSTHLDASLAKALHCLQDSFSPAHVRRCEVDEKLPLGSAKKQASPACFESGPPIRRIFDYNHPHDDTDAEAKAQHDEEDYYGGSPDSAPANAAAYASAALIRVALDSIARRQSNSTAWAQFTSRWLSHRLQLDIAGKPQAPLNLDTILQRSCSPSKMVCGRCPD